MDSRQQLAKRIALCTERDNIKGFVFTGVIGHLKANLGDTAVETILRSAQAEPSHSAFFSYPLASLLKILQRALDVPGVDADAGAFLWAVAGGAVNRSLESPLGKTMAMLGSSNPHRLLSASPTAMIAVISGGERKYEKTGERSAMMRHRHELMGPDYMAGMGERTVLSIAKVKPRIQMHVLDAAAADFDLAYEW